jgi:hypothetical protein
LNSIAEDIADSDEVSKSSESQSEPDGEAKLDKNKIEPSLDK